MKAIASEAASGFSSAREAARRLGLPPSSVHNILRQILQLYPYKLQSCNGLLPARYAQGSICEVGLSKMEQIPPGFLTSCGQMNFSRFMVTLTTITVAFGRSLIHTFGEDRIVSRRCRYPWPPRSPDLTPADFWLWGYLKSRVYLSGPSSLSELKDAIRRSGRVALYRCWICHSSGMSSPLWWWSCGTYSGVIKL
ncbi:uncharacterized protein TNCV_1998211 [Trichonephila clavipes]|nr:uncharacterized protein TNCV_1998211 [Trichonephila clavipes]